MRLPTPGPPPLQPVFHQPNARVMLTYLGRKQFSVFAWVPHQKWAAEARRESGGWLLHAHLGASHLGRVATNEVVHRLGWR
jgi:hypothetical protein